MKFNISKVAVLGAGVMGAGIAAHIAGAGIPVCLLDIVPKELSEEEKAKGLTLESVQFRNKFAQSGKDRVTNPKNKAIYDKDLGDMIQVGNFTDNMDMLSDCDWIIEVILENLEAKKKLMEQISEYRRPGTIVSSNTSGVSINKIIENMPVEFRQHFLGTHFFNPPRYMKLFELIPSNDTMHELMNFMGEFGIKGLGKGVVVAKDTPNFIGNRIGVFALSNVIKLMKSYGYDIPKVDQLTGPVIGRPKSATFRTIDMVGLDVLYNVSENIIKIISDEKEIEELRLPDLVGNMVKVGQLGDKSGQGFYKKVKTQSGNQTFVWDVNKGEYVESARGKIDAVEKALKERNKLEASVYGEAKENKFTWEVIKNVLLYSAGKVPEIADDYHEIDKAMRWGYNWELGPFEIWDAIGLERSIERMKAEGDSIPAWIEKKLAAGDFKFYDTDSIEAPYITLASPKNKVVKANKDAALVDIGDDVVCLQFKSKGNTITDDIMDFMIEAVEETEKNYKGLVIGNQGKNFSAGANLALIGGLAVEHKWNELEKIIDKFQKGNMLFKYSKKPVVAAPYGMTLGGGAEIALHSYAVAAHAETYMGLVEVGVGLVPGGGGTKELLIRSMEGLGKESAAEMFTRVKKVWETIATAKVSGSGHEAFKNGFLRKTDKVVMSQEYLITEAKNMVLNLYNDGFKPQQKKPVTVLGTSGRASIQGVIDFMLKGRFISEYDAVIANKLAVILTGSMVPSGVMVQEEQILELEKEAFISLCGEAKTLQRIEHMLKTGKALRN